jgi:hypothetical protein
MGRTRAQGDKVFIAIVAHGSLKFSVMLSASSAFHDPPAAHRAKHINDPATILFAHFLA